MAQKIFVNLPVRDLRKAMDFFGKLGFTFNAQFTDETAACSSTTSIVLTPIIALPAHGTHFGPGTGSGECGVCRYR